MRVEELDLISYGALTDTRLDLSRPTHGVTLVVGPNEAGKSTTLRALRALLFGVPRGSDDDFGRGRESIRIGGHLRAHDGTTLEVIRQGLTKRALIAPNGDDVDPARLAALLGGADAALFTNLFCIGHRELVENSESLLDAEGELGRLVFGATVGATALSRVQLDFSNRAEQIFKSGGSRPPLNQRLSQRNELLKRARDAQVRALDWGRDEDERRAVEQQMQSLTADLTAERANSARLARIERTTPRFLKLRELRATVEDLERTGPVAPLEWADAVIAAETARVEAVRDIAREEPRRDALRLRVDETAPPNDLLEAAIEIERVAEGIGRQRKDEQDLPGLENRLHQIERDIDDLLERLGAQRGDDEFGRSVTDSHLSRVETLEGRYPALEASLRNARAELTRTEEAIADSRRRLDALPATPDVDDLRVAHRSGVELLAIERELVTQASRIAAERADAAAKAGRLGLGAMPIDEVERLPVPLRSELDQLRAEHDKLDARIGELESRIDRLEKEREQHRRETPAPDAGDLALAREHRETGWRHIRAALDGRPDPTSAEWAAGQDLPEAYETAVSAADDVADQRYAHAESLAHLDRIDQELEAVAEDLREAEDDRASREQSWAALWAPVGILPGSPTAMLEWRTTFDEVCAHLVTARTGEADLAERTETVARAVEALKAALFAHGECPTADARLSDLVPRAGHILAQADDASNARRETEQKLEGLENELPNRRHSVADAETALTEWTKQWREALLPLGLDDSTSIAEARTTRDCLVKLRSLRKERSDLLGRITGLRRDIEQYRARVTELTTKLAPDLESRDALDAARELNARLQAAKAAAAEREALTEQLDEADAMIAEARDRERDAATDLQTLAEAVGLRPADDLVAVAERARDIADHRSEITRIEMDLSEQESGLPVEVLRCEAEEYGGDLDRVQAELHRVQERIAELDEALQGLMERRGELNEKLRAVDGSAAAADLEQDAAEQLAEAAALGEEWVRIRLAAAVLTLVINEFSEHHQQPILERAAKAFATMTSGAFTGLEIDIQGGKQIVLARRRNGEHLRIDQLSDGTRDQLYLALRLAGVHHHLDAMSEPLPLVLDDLLVNFDDQRAAAALQVLAELGERTQVLLFTHHVHTADLALEALGPARCAVVALEARDHDAPPPVAPAAPTRSAPARAGFATDAILDCLAGSPVPIGKAEIIAMTGIADREWGPAIRSLVDEGRVIQEGAKRGAKYRLP